MKIMLRGSAGGGVEKLLDVLLGLADPFAQHVRGRDAEERRVDLARRRFGEHAPQKQAAGEDAEKAFISKVLADTEDVWTAVFKSFGRTYTDPPLVIYSGITRTACGAGQAAMGPFYCPLDKKVYVDLAFYDELKRKFNVSGDFAQAYVIAHEVGHHVQDQLGILDKVQDLKNNAGDEAEANQIQVRTEIAGRLLWPAFGQTSTTR